MAIAYEVQGISFPKIKRRETTRWIKQVITNNCKQTGNITFIFCSDAEMLRINNYYLKHDYYTDVISFDYSYNNKISGDIFISLETVQTNSEKFKTRSEEELFRVMIHGILHLCGFNDKTISDKKKMKRNEDDALALITKLYM